VTKSFAQHEKGSSSFLRIVKIREKKQIEKVTVVPE
jgi:hypothetical protein